MVLCRSAFKEIQYAAVCEVLLFFYKTKLLNTVFSYKAGVDEMLLRVNKIRLVFILRD